MQSLRFLVFQAYDDSGVPSPKPLKPDRETAVIATHVEAPKMHSKHFLTFTTACSLAFTLSAPPAAADAQGLFRRLRERVGPLLAPPPAPAPQNLPLPARPLPSRPQGPLPAQPPNTLQRSTLDEVTSRAPTARYRSPNRGAALDRLSPTDGPGRSPAGVANSGPTIGIRGVEADPGYPAVQVVEILSTSQAQEFGLRVGDFIFAVDGVPTPSVRELGNQIAQRDPGDTVRLRVGRGGEVFDLTVPLTGSPDASPPMDRFSPAAVPSGASDESRTAAQDRTKITERKRPATELPDPSATPESETRYGIIVDAVPGQRGVTVRSIKSGSAAASAGFQTGDRIVSVDGMMVTNANAFTRLLDGGSRQANREVRVIRDNQLINLDLDAAGQSQLPSAETSNAETSNAKASTPTRANANSTPMPTAGSLSGSLGSLFGGVFGKSPNADAGSAGDTGDKATAQEPSSPAAVDDALDLNDQILPSPKAVEAENAELQSEIKRLREKLKALESRLNP